MVLAYQERKARYRLDVCEAKAAQAGDGWTLNGTKSMVPAGDQADAFLVPAQADGKIALFLVERSGRRRRRARLRHAGRRPRRRSGVRQGAPPRWSRWTASPRSSTRSTSASPPTCAEAVGVMDKTLAVTVDYMNTRKQFGVAIATFQALRHRVADMKMQLELARSMSYYASAQAQRPGRRTPPGAGPRQVPAGRVDALCRPAGGAAARRHRRDRRIHRAATTSSKLTQLEMTFGDTLHHLGEVSARMQDTAGVFA